MAAAGRKDGERARRRWGRAVKLVRFLFVLLVVAGVGGSLALNFGPGPRFLGSVVTRLAEPYGIAPSVEAARLTGLRRVALYGVELPVGHVTVRAERAYLTFDVDEDGLAGVLEGGPAQVTAGGSVFRADGFEVAFTAGQDGLEIAQLTVRRGEAVVTAAGTVHPDGAFDLALRGEDLALETDLPFLAGYGFAGPAAFTGSLTGGPGHWRLEGDGTVGPATLWGRSNVTGTGHLVWTPEGLTFTDVRLYQYGGEYVLEGEWRFAAADRPGSLDLALHARSGRLSELLAVLNLPLPATGRLYGDVRFSGPVNDLAAEGEVELVEAVLWEQPFDRLTGAFAWTDGTVTLDGVEAALGTGAARVAGRLDTQEGSIEIGFAATDWPLGFTQRFDAALGDFVGGLVDIPVGQIAGTLHEPELTAEVVAEALRVGPALFREVEGVLAYQERRLQLRGLQGRRAGGGRYELSGHIDFSAGTGGPQSALQLDVEGEQLGSLLQLAGEELPAALIDGSVSGVIAVQGSITDPRAELDLFLQEAFILRRGLHVTMEYAGGALRVTGLEWPKA